MRSCIIALLFFFLLFTSCSYFKKSGPDQNEKPLARVNEKFLYHSDIEHIVKNAGSAEDSSEIVSNYINDWIKHTLVLDKALDYLPDEKLQIQKQIEDYRQSLIIHLYEKELVLQKMDTTVSENELNEFYENFKANFELKEDVIQFYYLKLAKGAPKMDSLHLWIKSEKEDDKIKLSDYCFQYAADFSISDSVWYEMQKVYKQIPLNERDLATLSRNKDMGMVEDSLYHYVIKVNDMKIKSELAPLNYVKDDIARIILNKRRLDLINSTYEKIYQDGVRKNSFEIYP